MKRFKYHSSFIQHPRCLPYTIFPSPKIDTSLPFGGYLCALCTIYTIYLHTHSGAVACCCGTNWFICLASFSLLRSCSCVRCEQVEFRSRSLSHARFFSAFALVCVLHRINSRECDCVCVCCRHRTSVSVNGRTTKRNISYPNQNTKKMPFLPSLKEIDNIFRNGYRKNSFANEPTHRSNPVIECVTRAAMWLKWKCKSHPAKNKYSHSAILSCVFEMTRVV